MHFPQEMTQEKSSVFAQKEMSDCQASKRDHIKLELIQ